MEILSDATFKGRVEICSGDFVVTGPNGAIQFVVNSHGISEFGVNIFGSSISAGSLYLSEDSIYSSGGLQHIFQGKCGTIAHTSDIPDTSNFALKSEVNSVKNRVLHSAIQTIDFDVPSDCTLFKVGPLTDRLDGEKIDSVALSVSMFKVVSAGDPNELDPNNQLCYVKFANFADLMAATDGYVYINKASGYSISASDKYGVFVIW